MVQRVYYCDSNCVSIKSQEVEISKKRPAFIKSKERVTYIQKKLNSAKKSLEEVRRADEAHKKDIEELELSLIHI